MSGPSHSHESILCLLFSASTCPPWPFAHVQLHIQLHHPSSRNHSLTLRKLEPTTLCFLTLCLPLWSDKSRHFSQKQYSAPAKWVVGFDVRFAAHPSSCSSSFLLPSLPDLICQLLIAVSLAGSHLPALDSNGLRRTSTGESLRAVGFAGLQPARVWALWAAPWASPGFNRTSTARNKV